MEYKIEENEHKKLIWIESKIAEFEREKQVYIIAYHSTLDAFLIKNKLDKNKKWTFDIKTGTVKEFIEEKKDGNSTDGNNA